MIGEEVPIEVNISLVEGALEDAEDKRGGQRSGSDMTPRDVFNDLCGMIFTGELRNVFASRKDFVCVEELVSTSRSPDHNLLTDFGSPPIPFRALCIRNKLHSGVPPPTTESNKEAVCRSSGKTRHGAYLKYTQNIMLQHRGEDQRVNPTPLICSTNPTAVSLRGLRREYHQPIDRSGLTPASVYSESVGQREKEKITRAPRERETRTHLKKVSHLRGGGEFLLIIRRPVWQGFPQIQQPVVASESPRSAMQDPIQAPPGATRQAGLYNS
ncbi:hypothetical protein TNCV_4089841 [Trichonephila clavipes]|nr:hypothetical protein TNCV_4089841 [Trichonephila clavipes]